MASPDSYNQYSNLPDMGDFYFEANDNEYQRMIYDSINPQEKGKEENGAYLRLKDPAATIAFCKEEPPEEGYNPDFESYCIKIEKGSGTEDDWIGNVRVVDGDTLIFKPGGIKPVGEKCINFVKNLTQQTQLALQEFSLEQSTGGLVGTRFACIDTMEIPHFECIGEASLYSDVPSEEAYLYDVKKNSHYVKSLYKDYREEYYSDNPSDKERLGRTYIKGRDDFNDASHKEESKRKFMQIGSWIKDFDYYYQYFDLNGKRYIIAADDTIDQTPEKTRDGGRAREVAWSAIRDAEEIRWLVDGTSVNRVGSSANYTSIDRFSPGTASSPVHGIISLYRNFMERGIPLSATGFSLPGLDVYDRALSVIYVKLNGEWYNLNKWILAHTQYTAVNSTMHSGETNARNNFYSRLINASSYEIDNIVYVDTMNRITSAMDDRSEVQKKIFGNPLNPGMGDAFNIPCDNSAKDADPIVQSRDSVLNKLNRWTVTIADVTFMIPPESISSVTSASNVKLPLIRAKGAMTKGATRVLRHIQINLYFYGDAGINGVGYDTYVGDALKEDDRIKGGKVKYHMNGLRSLIAQFKVAPFVPIENEYINKVLCVDAVSMEGLAVQTVPGFPRLLRATLRLTEFDYRVYMPEIPMDLQSDFGFKNMFARQIYYPLFRYYYQRLLMNGDRLKDVSPDSYEYITSTFGNKTCLVPMNFKSSKIRFYIPDRERLNMLKQAKIDRISKPATALSLNDNQKCIATDFGNIYDALLSEANPSAMDDAGKEKYPKGKEKTEYEKLNDLVKDKANNGYYIIFNPAEKGKDWHVMKHESDGKGSHNFLQDDTSKSIESALGTQWRVAQNSLRDKLNNVENSLSEKVFSSLKISTKDNGYKYTTGNDATVKQESESQDKVLEDWESPTLIISRDIEGVLCLSDTDYTSTDKNALYTMLTQSQQTGSSLNANIYSYNEVFPKNKIDIPISITLDNISKWGDIEDLKINIGSEDVSGKNIFIKKIGDCSDDESVSAPSFHSFSGIDMDALAKLKSISANNAVGGNEFANALKDATDRETIDTIKWIKYPVGMDGNGVQYDIDVEDISITLGNNFTPIALQGTYGTAPQFMGGTDSQITFSATISDKDYRMRNTPSEETLMKDGIKVPSLADQMAAALNELPKIAAAYTKEYRLVLSSWPIKIDSDITKLFGINDVLIDTVQLDTVPGLPGTYRINVVMTSVDRTLRNREALQKTDIENFTNLSKNGRAITRYIEYENINNLLSEAELYPDLELPSLEELQKYGWRFVKYSSSKRKYPDPDFYFVYSHQLMSSIVRNAVLKSQDAEEMKMSVYDTNGQDKFTWDTNNTIATGVFSKENENSKDQVLKDVCSSIANSDNSAGQTEGKGESENTANAGKLAQLRLTTLDETWDVCNDIKVAFCEGPIANSLFSLRKKMIAKWKELKNSGAVIDGVNFAEFNDFDEINETGIEKIREAVNTATIEQKNKNKGAKQAVAAEKETASFSVLVDNVTNSQKKLISNSSTNNIVNQLGYTEAGTQEVSRGDAPAVKKDNKRTDEEDAQMISWIEKKYGSIISHAITKIDSILAKKMEDSDVYKYDVSSLRLLTRRMSVGIFSKDSEGGETVDVITKFIKAAACAVSSTEEKGTTDDKVNNDAGWEYDSENWSITIARGGTSVERYTKQNFVDEFYVQQEAIKKNKAGNNYPQHVTSPKNKEKANDYAKKQLKALLEDQNNVVIEWGIFSFKTYDRAALRSFYSDDDEKIKDICKPYHGGRCLLDPYYRSKDATADEQAEYIFKTLTDEVYAFNAFWRICLFWIRCLLCYYILPSLSYDIMRESLKRQDLVKQIIDQANLGTITGQNDAIKKLKDSKKKHEKELEDLKNGTSDDPNDNGSTDQKNVAKNNKINELKRIIDNETKELEAAEKRSAEIESSLAQRSERTANACQKQFENNCNAIDKGKLFLVAFLAATNDKEILNLVSSRDIKGLNSITKSILSGSKSKNSQKPGTRALRKYIKALIGYEVIDMDQLATSNDNTVSESINRAINRSNALSASCNPRMWLTHSFYDMVVNDARGRMARAFPTFYMVFIDEGRKIGQWKLHDNFYNTSSISEITVAKSRKIPADTAEIVMSNFFQTYTTDDEDINNNYTFNYSDVVDRLWSPKTFAEKVERQRQNSPAVERIHLTAGTRIQIRMGYGANAANLPIMFNGLIAEIESADVVRIVAQGDGHELSKPILLDKYAHEIPYLDMSGPQGCTATGTTPKTILDSLLTTKGGVINSMMQEYKYSEKGWKATAAYIVDNIGCSDNPLGIYHFGDRNYQYMPGEPEPTQNIYEVFPINIPPQKKGQISEYSMSRLDPTAKENSIFSLSNDNGELNGWKALGYTAGGAAAFMFAAAMTVSAGGLGLLAAGTLGAAVGPKGIEAAGIGIEETLKSVDKAINSVQSLLDADMSLPLLDFQIFGKTFWDVANIVKNIDGEYIAAIAPFGFRSTFFFGRLHDYYAYQYDYDKETRTWNERRKPFQQFHIVTSLTDIIGNQIQASAKGFSTCMVGLYEVEKSFNTKETKYTDTLWVDKDIYPEYQKTSYYDTKLYGTPSRSVPVVSSAMNFFGSSITNSDIMDRNVDETGDVRSHHSTAWRLTRSALRENMQEMYTGSMTLIGDPTIKPFDRIHIDDSYQEISGDVQVRDVVHTLSATDGFTTTVFPDLITTTKDGVPDEYSAAGAIAGIMRPVGMFIIGQATSIFFSSLLKSGRSWPAFKTNFEKIFGKDLKHLKFGAKQVLKNTGSLAWNAGKTVATGAKLLAQLFKLRSAAAGTATAAEMFSSIGGAAISLGKSVKLLFSATPWGWLFTVAGLGMNVMIDYVDKMIKGNKCVVLFPLIHYKKPMTAGINGSSGICYGAHSPDSGMDILTSMISRFAESNPTTAKIMGWLVGAANGNDIFESAKALRDIAKGYAISDAQRAANTLEDVHTKSQEGLYNRFQIDIGPKRVGLNNTEAYIKTLQKYSVAYPENSYMSAEMINKHPSWKEAVSVNDIPALQEYIVDYQFFRIAANSPGFDKRLSKFIVPLELTNPNNPGKKKTYRAFMIEEDAEDIGGNKYKRTVYDIPFVSKDAARLLTAIVRRTYQNTFGTQEGQDKMKIMQDMADQCLVFKSGMRVNSLKGYTSTGNTFQLEPLGDRATKGLKIAIEEIQKEIEEIHKKDNSVTDKVFKADWPNKNALVSTNVVVIQLYPKKEG